MGPFVPVEICPGSPSVAPVISGHRDLPGVHGLCGSGVTRAGCVHCGSRSFHPTAAQKPTQSCPLCCCESPWLRAVSAQDPLPGFRAEIYSQPEGSRCNSSPAFILCCCLGEYVNCGGTRLFSSCLQMYYFNLDIASLSKQVWIRSILHVIPAAS